MQFSKKYFVSIKMISQILQNCLLRAFQLDGWKRPMQSGNWNKRSQFHYLLLIYCFILDMTNNRFDMRTRFPLKQYFFLITVSVRHLHLKDQSDWNFEHHPGQLQWHIRRILGKVDLVHQYFTKIHLHHLISWIVIFRRSHARWTWRPFQLQEIFLPDDLLMPELFVSFLL